MNEAAHALREGHLHRFQVALEEDPGLARKPQIVVDAGRWARLDALELLLKHGADLNAQCRGYRALHALIQERPHKETNPSKDHLECLQWLLENGADPEQLGAWPPARAIIVAAFTGVEPFVAILRKGGARIDGFAACALADAGIVKNALEREPAFANGRDAGGLTALQCCVGSRLGRKDGEVQRKLHEIAGLLLDAGADPNAKTKSWSHLVDTAYFAISAGSAEILELLLDRGADPTAALSSAAWHESGVLAEITLRHGARLNEAVADGRPLLNELVRWGQVKQALWLLEHGVDPNIPDASGWTAVHQAASRGNERMFRAILAAGGEPRREDGAGKTPLDIARFKGRNKIVAAIKGK